MSKKLTQDDREKIIASSIGAIPITVLAKWVADAWMRENCQKDASATKPITENNPKTKKD